MGRVDKRIPLMGDLQDIDFYTDDWAPVKPFSVGYDSLKTATRSKLGVLTVSDAEGVPVADAYVYLSEAEAKEAGETLLALCNARYS